MRGLIRRLLPASILQDLDARAEQRALDALPKRSCDTTALRRDVPDLRRPELEDDWKAVQAALQSLELGDLSGAVNPGDRRAIYYLTRALRPRAVLEVGTHLGASTSILSLALKHSGVESPSLTTVDILDVNGPEGAWVRLKSKHPPRSLVSALGCPFVEFVVSPSVDFLRQCSAKFDLIFLDGGHEATTVYQEVPAALNLLRPNGLILLHDVYPHQQPLWSDGVIVPGPWLAIERFRAEGAKMKAVPLGALPWPTKLNSNVTSLACLVAD